MFKTMRRNIAFIMVLAMVINLIPVMTLTASAGGDVTPSTSLAGSGTAASPFLIASAADLAYMRDQINAGGNITPTGGGADVIAKLAHYRLTADIVLGYWQDDGDGIVEEGEIYDSESGGTAYTESNWTGIAFSSRIIFSGTFNGDGHTVSGIYINEPSSDYHGLFGNVRNGTIKNVGVKDSYINGKNHVGGVAGYNSGSGGKVENCYNTGSVSGSTYVGGIVGINVNWGTAQYCYNTGNVSGNRYVGGISGYNCNETKISYCYNAGSVSGTDYTGGIVGINGDMLQYCYNAGSISGSTLVGGIVGYTNSSGSTIQYCYNTGNVNGNSGGGVGGITGYSAQGTLTDNYYDKQVCPIGGSSGNDREGKIEGKLTSELTNGTAFSDWSSGDMGTWNFTEGLYPRLTGYVVGGADFKMDETDAALVSASPVFLAATDTAATVKYDFTLSTANGVGWSSSDESVVSIDGSNATVEIDGTTTLTASLGDVTKSITLTVDMTPPTLQGATRDNDNQITVTLSKPCLNLANENDGGFTVTATGTEETFAVSGTAQGTDASQVVLTVADMGAAKANGVTITYTEGENGTITDIAGNPLATDSTGVAITPWAPKLNTPEGLTWDTEIPAKATWNAVENATGYTAQLYKDGIASGSLVTGITDTYYDFSAVITETDTYTFTVQAIGDGATYSDGDMSSKSPVYSYTVPIYISDAEINMAAPAAGAVPQTAEQIETATSNADYTVAGIVWHEALTAGDRFKAGQVYTATVTLTSKNAKEFQAAPFTPTVEGASLVGTTTAEGTGIGNKVTFAVTFTATDAQSVMAIAVTAQPDKMIYTERKDGVLNLEGMVVTEIYNDETTKEIAFEDGTAPGYTTVPANGAVLTNSINNSNPVTITHTESGKTATTDNLTVNTPPTYTVTFKNWNGSELKTETVEHGSGATAPAEPTREGYHFTGWDADLSKIISDLTVTAVFEINEYTVTYTAGANGSITGTATQTVSHGNDGTAVTAVPDAGYHFVKWSDDVTTATRMDTGVTGNISVSAEFAINEYTLAYTAGANGSITGASTQTVSHGNDGTAVTAVPDEGYHFVKWSDDVTTATRTDTGVTGDITVSATFALNEYTLTYTARENGSITGTATQTVSHGSDGTAVTAVPDEGYHFVKWSDGVTTATRMDENITGNISVTAEFAINTYTVTFKNWDGSDLKTEIVEHGSGATAPAEPTREGYHFTGWDADFSKIISDLTVAATFAINEYTLIYTAGENGSISGITPQSVSHGSDGTAVTAVPDAGYHFVKWSDEITTATRTDTSLTGDIAVTATFTINTYTVTFKNWNGSELKTEIVEHGSGATAPAEPVKEGYHFTGWDADFSNVTSDLTATATFALNEYTLTYTSGANGSITGVATQTVSHGNDGTAVIAVPDEGYHFVKWGDEVTTATRMDTGVTGNISVSAEFAVNEYTLAYTAGANGSINGITPQAISHGSDGTAVTAVPDAGYHFVKWSDEVTTATRTDTGVTGDITVTATFDLKEYTLTYTAGANGSITGTAIQTVSHGSDGTAVTAVPDAGYHFVKWSDDVTTATRTDTGVTGDITVTAEFAINEYTLTYTAGENGSITGTATQTVSHGNDGTAVTAVPDEGYHFVKWSDDIATATRTDTSVTGDIAVTATFALNEYTLTYTAGANGSITGTATQTVSHGSDGTAVTAVPDEGYHFVKWSDDVTTAIRTDENVMGNISVTAIFAAIEPKVVTAIAVKMQPTKLTYTAGETLDLAGLIATLTYNDGRTVDVAYAQFRANGITANPDQGTTMEVAIHNGQAIILTCETQTATTGNLTINAAPTYAITLSETGIHTFTALTVGYTPVAPIAVTVTKTGTGNITSLSAALSGTDADNFTLGALDAATLDGTTASAEFTMKPNDALAPGTYTATVMVTADNGINQGFNICFTVNAPSAPTIQSAVAGNTHVNITWSSVPGATGYKIYQSTVLGSYGAALATVSDSVYNYDAAGLSNGTTYFFVVRAGIGIYDSANSNEVSSTPQVPAPGAPVLQTAVAGDEHVNLTWSEVEGSIGYKIYASTTSGLYTSPVDTVAGSVYSCDVTGLTNGIAYYFVVTASNPGGDSGYSNEISAIPQVSAPSAPIGLTATGENGKVILSWNSTAEATGYKIYQSEVAGSYGTALTTVAESVYSYEITGLTNGVVYYFVIKATNAGGDSPYSAEVTVIPVTVPGAPTNVAAAAGSGQVTVSFTPPADNGGSTITGYKVTSDPGNFTAAGIGTTITVTGLSNGTVYTFTVTASNAAGTGPASEVSNAATPYRRSSGGSTPSTPPEQPADTGVDILVNGKTEIAATATTTQEGNKTITAVVVDDKKVEKRLEQEGNNAVVAIPIMSGADVVIGTLNGQTVKNMESKNAVLEIKTGQVTYTLPAFQINIDAVSGQIGKQVELKDIAVSVKISEPAEDTVKIVEDTADRNNYQIIVKPIEFEVTCSSGSKTVEVFKFSAYVERMIAIPDGVDPSKITTGVILNSDGTFSHVPTAITMIDGKYYAKINSLANSTYLLIYCPKAFKDVGRHWTEKDVNDMASRLVVSGIGNDKFEPDRDITRAEFAAIVVRALGLMSPGTGKDAFIDVTEKNWYYDAVSIAYEYGIISGYGNGKFGPDDKITREQAMTMIARAMKITGSRVELADGEADKLLTRFTDANSVAEYAKANIASCVKAGIVSGRNEKQIAPKDNITRAEVAVIVQRLLRNSKLI